MNFILLLLFRCSFSINTFVLIDDEGLKETHSIFFNSLRDRGHTLTIRHIEEEKNQIENYGVWQYDNLILFCPSAEDLGDSLSVEKVVAFIDSGRNVLVAANSNVGDAIREIGNECGVDFDEEDTQVIDHFNYEASDPHHTLLVFDNWVQSPVMLGNTLKSPILFRGIGHAAEEKSTRLLTKLLPGKSTTYSSNPQKRVVEYPQSAGADTLLVTAIQARNNARVVFTGSLEMFSNEFFLLPITSTQGTAFKKSGNEEFCVELSKWNFQERGILRASNFKHNKKGETNSSSSYRIKDQVEVSVFIEEYNNGKWQPFTQKDVQVEVVMLDPYIRKTMNGNKGFFSTSLVLPDVYGIFKFEINYHRLGYSSLELSQTATVHPYQHNDYDRFIPVAYPYYLSSFLVMGAFLLFGILFLYTKD